MSKKTGIVVLTIALLALALAAVALGLTLCCGGPEDVQYVLYLGTNGKDSNAPVFPPEEAQAQAEKILLEHFGGYTIQAAQGGWVDDGTQYQEYTLVIHLSDTTLDQVHAAADDLIRVFDQSSVLIQANTTRTEFYAGAK